MFSDIEIIIGTYEDFLLGYKFDIRNEKPTLTQSFADKSHSGSIKCVALHERWVASGGTDDRIYIYDMTSRNQSQILLSHEGTVNSLAFTPDGTHLLSGGEDGRMVATRVKTWITDATWKKAHNGSPVTNISCHPSGKLAISIGSDLILRTWNLVKGRVAYKTNLKSRNTLSCTPECLSWSFNGDYFTITGQRVLEFWSIKTADVIRSHKTKSKPVCLTWITNSACLVGLEDGKILWLSVDNEEEKEIVAHNARVKAMCFLKQLLVSASSSGEVKLWQIIEDQQKLKEITTTNIGCRPTCIGILDLQQFGPDYVISSTLEAKEKVTKSANLKEKVPQRGIVTIEYDSDDVDEKGDSEEDGESNNEVKNTENEEESVSEVEDDTNDAKCNEDASDYDSDEIAEENSDDCYIGSEVNLSKSHKRKLQVGNSKNIEKKKHRLDNKVKVNKNFIRKKNVKPKRKLNK